MFTVNTLHSSSSPGAPSWEGSRGGVGTPGATGFSTAATSTKRSAGGGDPRQQPSTRLTPPQQPSTRLTPRQQPSAILVPRQQPSTTWLRRQQLSTSDPRHQRSTASHPRQQPSAGERVPSTLLGPPRLSTSQDWRHRKGSLGETSWVPTSGSCPTTSRTSATVVREAGTSTAT